MKQSEFKTTHDLPFEFSEWKPDGIFENVANLLSEGWLLFRVGTCHGQWRAMHDAYEILSVINNQPGNGHLEDVLQWFEHSCRRDKRKLRIREIWNEKFKIHLLKKRGFKTENNNDVVKVF